MVGVDTTVTNSVRVENRGSEPYHVVVEPEGSLWVIEGGHYLSISYSGTEADILIVKEGGSEFDQIFIESGQLIVDPEILKIDY